MKRTRAFQHKQRLDSLFKKAKASPAFSDDPELQSHWARYLCVLASAYLETAVREIYSSFAQERASQEVANFVRHRLQQFRNPNMDRILQIAAAFRADWRDKLIAATSGAPFDAVNSIVENRHKIAHGRDVALTLTQISNYYKDALKVVSAIEKQCGN